MRDTQWFYKRGWGISVHYLSQSVNNPDSPRSQGRGGTSWDACTADFDPHKLAAQAASVGAGYLIFTMVQVTRFLAAPNEAFDRITGYLPGEACTSRDLVEELYEALRPYDIDLLLYFPCDGPTTDPIAREAFGSIRYGEPHPYVTDAFVDKWAQVIATYSRRYGGKIRGWWLDGCYYNIGYTNEKLARIADACRAGNPDALVASNLYGLVDDFAAVIDHVRCGCPSDDYTFGEMWGFQDLPYAPFIGHCRWHLWSSLSYQWRDERFRLQPYTPEYLRDYAKAVHRRGGIVTFDTGINRDGSLDPSHLEKLSLLRDAIEEE